LGEWVERTGWVEHLAREPKSRSNTSVCLVVKGDDTLPKGMAKLLSEEGIAHDIAAHRDSPPGLRIWCGSTVETTDIAALLPWLDWSYAAVAPHH
ncbi:MAG TPA: phosphoserine aminotransferase, partial [Aestuariivirgaceae bacterium]|nr:phosphoserine aminotransferase [Aestuariivirgaceae bacterium]